MQSGSMPPSRPRRSSSLLELTRVVVKWRWFIASSTLVSAVLIVVFSLYTLKAPANPLRNPMPNQYTSQAKVRFAQSESSLASLGSGGLAALLGATASSASGSSTTSLLSGPTDADLAQALLTGNTLADAVTARFDFVRRYHITRDPLTESRRIFLQSLSASYDETSGILTIGYRAADRVFATDVLRYTLEELAGRFSSLTEGKAAAKVHYLQQRLPQVERDLRDAENKLVDFQVARGIIDPQSQFQAAASQVAAVESQIQAKEVELQTLKRYGRSGNDPAAVRVQNELAILRNLAGSLKSGSGGYTLNSIPQDQIPAAAVEYANLQLAVTLESTLYSALRQQYETAKLESMAAAKSFEIVEPPQVPEVKSGPHRGTLSAVVVILTFICALLAALVMEYFDRAAKDPIEAAKLAALKRLLRGPSPRAR